MEKGLREPYAPLLNCLLIQGEGRCHCLQLYTHCGPHQVPVDNPNPMVKAKLVTKPESVNLGIGLVGKEGDGQGLRSKGEYNQNVLCALVNG